MRTTVSAAAAPYPASVQSRQLESGDHAHGRVEYPAVVREEAAEDVVARCEVGQREPARPVRADHAWSAQRLREVGGRAALPTAAEPADEVGRGLAFAEPEDRPVMGNRIAVCEAVDTRPAEMGREQEAKTPVCRSFRRTPEGPWKRGCR
jgi:hypothetical protein